MSSFREYIFKRAFYSVITWILVLILNFLLFYTPSPKMVGQPFIVQAAEYFNFVFVERFGPHPVYGTPLLDYILGVSVYSLLLLALSLAIAITLGVLLGTLVSYKQGGKIDALLTIIGIASFAFPAWWVCLVLRMYLYPTFPAFGWHSEEWWSKSPLSDLPSFIPDFLSHLTLPLLTLVLTLTGIYLLVTRNSLRSIYTEDYIRTAKAKGASPLRIMFKHALKNAMVSVVSIIALTPSLLVIGIIVVEYVFQRLGIGYILMSSVIDPVSREILPPSPQLQAVFVVFSTIIITLHFIVDVSLRVLDPRISIDGAGLHGKRKKAKKRKISKSRWEKTLDFLKKFMKGYSGKFGVGVLLFFTTAALLAPILPLPDPFHRLWEIEPSQPPSLQHLLGTDYQRRDVLSAIFWAARSSLMEGLGAVALALVIGCFVGLFSGSYSDGWIGYWLDRITDLFLSVPIIVMVVYFPMRPSPLKWMIAVGLTTWTITAKLVRTQVISAKGKPFIEASKAAGAGDAYIIFRCLLPECVPAVASSVLFVAVTALSMQSCLDFFGFQRRLWSRIEPVTHAPYMSWGTLLSFGAGGFEAHKRWWIIFPPGICIALVGLALVAIGNKVIEVTNPRLTTYLARKRS